MARAALQVLSHKGAWLPEYLATGKLGEAFEAALRSEISLRATEDVPAFVQVSLGVTPWYSILIPGCKRSAGVRSGGRLLADPGDTRRRTSAEGEEASFGKCVIPADLG